MGENVILEIKDVCKSFKNKKVLKGVSFSIESGDIQAIMGPNGVGKTTLLRMITGLYEPDSGSINRAKVASDENYCSVLFEFNGLYPTFTLRENLTYFQNVKRNTTLPLSDEALNILKKLQIDNELDKRIRFFSKGMLRKVAVARAVIDNPRLLVLDEPFDGLDVESHSFLVKYLREWVKEGNRSIIISSHNVADIDRLCNKVVLLKDGTVLRNTTVDEMKRETYDGYILCIEESDKDKLEKCLKDLNLHYVNSEKNVYGIEVAENDIIKMLSYLKENDIIVVEGRKRVRDLEEIYLNHYEVRANEKYD